MPVITDIPLWPGEIVAFSHQTTDGWEHDLFSNGFIEPDGSFVEREYQAAKTLDPEWKARILACPKPFGKGGAKQLGRAAPLRPDWHQVMFPTMCQLQFAKYTDHPELGDYLVHTGYAQLIEGNTWHDNTWGDCHCSDPNHPECLAPGKNWLGLILMSVRETLRLRALASTRP